MKTLLILFMILGLSTSQTKTTINSTTLSELLQQYLLIKNTLVQSKEVQKLSTEFLVQAKNINTKALTAEEQQLWNQHSASIIKDAESMASTNKIEVQRKHFSSLSTHFYSLIKGSSITTKLYYQYCPMYNNSKGAYWISELPNIQNPYYGKKMLTCGSTKETLH